MPSHWTYSEFESNLDLCQGDIVRRTPELLSVLEVVHKHFCDEKYTGFLVLTQTCDLVRRKGSDCSARHVSLCVIRELEHVLPHMLREICGTEIAGVYTKEGRFFAEQLLVRIVNQTEQSRGLFYLHPDADVGIATPSVALLRISIALRREHYDVLMSARSGRIVPEFAAKLGWLTGNLFARVATPDWDEKAGKNAAKELAKTMLDSVSESDGRNWISEKWLEAARKTGMDFSALDGKSAFDVLQSHAPSEPLDVITDRIEKVSREVLIAEQAPKVRDMVRDDVDFLLSVADNVTQVVAAFVEHLNLAELSIQFRENTSFRESIANQVQATMKQASRDQLDNPVEATCLALKGTYGLIPPGVKAVKKILAENEILESEQSSIESQLKKSMLYDDAAVQRLQSIAGQLFSDGTIERIQKVIGRIRNDQHVKNALRPQQLSIAAE
jgi:hypothetical protein